MKQYTRQDLALIKRHRSLVEQSAKVSLMRAALPIGSSRARVTTLNAKWAWVAEERDRAEEILRARGLLPEEVCHE